MLEDKILIWRFNRGQKTALRGIYEKYRTDLLKVAVALLDDRSAIEDVLHDVFVSFAQRAGRFKLTGSLKGYLAICIANQARDRNRAMQRRSVVHLDDAGPISSNMADAEHSAISDEVSQQLNHAMAQLPYEQREAIILHLQSKMKFRQIAKSQDVSVNTVQSRYQYGLDKLRSILNGELK